MCTIVVVTALELLVITAAVIAISPSYPNLQHLNVKRAIADASTSLRDGAIPHQNQRLELLHRDALYTAAGSSTRLTRRVDRDVHRVAAVTRRVSADFGSGVIPGLDEGSGEYFARIGVGIPPEQQYLVVDSGSDLSWVQCQPCANCYAQFDPVFDPRNSVSFSWAECGSDACTRLGRLDCQSDKCGYEVSYGDGSYTEGSLALETIVFGNVTVQGVAIGCGHTNRGMFVGAAGLLGLGSGSMSLVGQLGGQIGGAFSYCLVTRGNIDTGWLQFGREALPVGASWIPLVSNRVAPSFYYVGLSGFRVGGAPVRLAEDVFRIDEFGQGGVIMDTGTAVTRLPFTAYSALRDAFLRQTSGYPRVGGISIFDTCFDFSGFDRVRVPTVGLSFSDGPTVTLPARNFLVPVDDRGTFCFAFAASSTGMSIIGNIQQEGIQISVDVANGFVGFGPYGC